VVFAHQFMEIFCIFDCVLQDVPNDKVRFRNTISHTIKLLNNILVLKILLYIISIIIMIESMPFDLFFNSCICIEIYLI